MVLKFRFTLKINSSKLPNKYKPQEPKRALASEERLSLKTVCSHQSHLNLRISKTTNFQKFIWTTFQKQLNNKLSQNQQNRLNKTKNLILKVQKKIKKFNSCSNNWTVCKPNLSFQVWVKTSTNTKLLKWKRLWKNNKRSPKI